MTDRAEQARAEAERRIGGGMGVTVNSAARQGFVLGVEWADANPKPHTITRKEADAAFIKVMLGRFATPDALVATLREMGVEVTDE